MNNQNSRKQGKRIQEALLNPLILDSIFGCLKISTLRECRLVCRDWNTVATQAIRKCQTTRLLFCSDEKCTQNLAKFLDCFKDTYHYIPYSKALLIPDHLPPPTEIENSSESNMNKEIDTLFDRLNLDKSKWKKEGFRFVMNKIDETFQTDAIGPFSTSFASRVLLKSAIKFCPLMENLIVTLSLRPNNLDSRNLEAWMTGNYINFPSLQVLNFHITKTSPDELSSEAFSNFLNSAPYLKKLSVRKTCKNGDEILNKFAQALKTKRNLNHLKCLQLNLLTENWCHLKILAEIPLSLEDVTLVYLGGEKMFCDQLNAIKTFLKSLRNSLRKLRTQIPYFSTGEIKQHTIFTSPPILHNVTHLTVEKIYKDVSRNEIGLIYGFDFSKYFPKLQTIVFQDYDMWKNLQLHNCNDVVKASQGVREITLPDLGYENSILDKYLKMFPNIQKLSTVISYWSKMEKQDVLSRIYGKLPQLKELNITIYDMQIPFYDTIFIGCSPEECEQLAKYLNFSSEETESAESLLQIDTNRLSISSLKNLEIVKLRYVNDAKLLGITDLTVKYGFLRMPSLKRITLGQSYITQEGMSVLTKHADVIQIIKDKEPWFKNIT